MWWVGVTLTKRADDFVDAEGKPLEGDTEVTESTGGDEVRFT
jgi:hypothetical protein